MREMVLSITAADRPEYLEEVLESWEMVDGVEELTAIFNVEPGSDVVVAMCEKADFFERHVVIVNRHRYGALANPWYALWRGFHHSDFVIVGEDDSIVSTDVLRYFDWSRQWMLHADVFAVCAFRKRYPIAPSVLPPEGSPFSVVSMGPFSPTIWGTNIFVWRERMRNTWAFRYRDKGWDWKFNEVLAPGSQCLQPWVSRSQHIGKFGGAHMPPQEFEVNQSDCFVADPPPVSFRLVP